MDERSRGGGRKTTPAHVEDMPVVVLNSEAKAAYHKRVIVYDPYSSQFEGVNTFSTMAMVPTKERVVRMRQEWKMILSVPDRSLRERGQRRGRIDTGRLWKVPTGGFDVFTQRQFKPTIDACIGMLVDCSGSMRDGRRIGVARQLALLFGEALDRNMVPFYCAGYTTESSSSGQVEKEAGKFINFKSWDQDWTSNLATLNFVVADWGSNPGEAVFWMAEKMKARSEKVKLLVLLSDGAPDLYWGQFAAKALWVASMEYARKNGILVRGVGCDYEGIREYVENSSVLHSVEELLEMSFLKEISKDFKSGVQKAFGH